MRQTGLRRIVFAGLLALAAVIPATGAPAAGDVQQGAAAFRVCSACHSLRPGLNMTGPSLATVWHRKAGSLASFDGYSTALKASGVIWNATTLDAWLKNPEQFIPGNHMTFPGVRSARIRANLIAFLHAVSEAERGGPKVVVPSAYTATPLNLKKLAPDQEVKAIRACGDSYFVTTGTGKVRIFWDQSLRFETDASKYGPRPGTPAILPAGMLGDRAAIIFASPAEISASIKQQC